MDICKGLGILLVVLGHLPIIGADLHGVDSFLFLFHVPLFFFLSGVFYKDNEPAITFIVKKIKGLYVPFILFNLFFLLFELVVGIIRNEPVDNLLILSHKILLGLDTTPLGSPTWFLLALFRATVLYKLIDLLSKNNIYVTTLLSISIFVLGLLLPDSYYLGPSLVAVLFYHCGHLYKKSGLKDRLSNLPSIWQVTVSITIIVTLVYIARMNIVDMRTNEYGNYPLFIVGSFLGVIVSLLVSSCISRYSGTVSTLFALFGRSSLWVLALHLFLFQLTLFAHGVILRFVPSTFDPPMWAWYFLCFLVGSSIPVLLLRLKTLFLHR